LVHDAGREAAPADAGRSLRELHDYLARYGGELPSFKASLDLARSALADDHAMRALRLPDRSMLRKAFDRLHRRIERHRFLERPLHGEAHAGNLLVTPAGPRWIDFESACMGPLEWDLAFLPEGAVAAFPEVDRELLDLLRTMNSARVATWCYVRWRFPEMRRHGEFHLEQVRRGEEGRSRRA
jgi:aminoglycoside phosphotransferase (APT) family kinase protein